MYIYIYTRVQIHRPTFIKIWKMRSVEQYSPIPYVVWVLYGLPLVHPHSMLVITINGTGTAIELAYVTLFLLCSAGATRRKVLLLLAGELAFVGAVAVLVITLAHTNERRSMIVGALFGTGMYAAPLSVMYVLVSSLHFFFFLIFVPWMPLIYVPSMVQKMVIQSRSVEYMPLSLASLVNDICWTTYALIKFDVYITVIKLCYYYYFSTNLIYTSASYKQN
jgi:solute carrier family 50 (sugar transporter)